MNSVFAVVMKGRRIISKVEESHGFLCSALRCQFTFAIVQYIGSGERVAERVIPAAFTIVLSLFE